MIIIKHGCIIAGMAAQRKATTTTISDQLRAAIAAAGERGVTRYRISKETGVEQAALSRFVRGRQGLDLSSVDRLATYLGLRLVADGAASPDRKG